MKKRTMIRILALTLVLAMTLLSPVTAGAVKVVGDVNGDGKVTVFDAQLLLEASAGLRQLDSANVFSVEGILDYILGRENVDAGDTNNDGEMEIYTAAGLQLLHEDPNGTYILMRDIDMAGADWQPVARFNGTLKGNGKTISNFTINTATPDSKNSSILNMGFFGDTDTNAVISDLHLRDVTLTTTEDAQSIGLFAGSLRGDLTGCTVTGTIRDTRTSHGSTVFMGVLAGRLTSGSGGSIVGGTTLAVSDQTGKYTTEGLCANVKLLITSQDKYYNNAGTEDLKLGLVGYAPKDYTVSGLWVDSSYSSSLLSETIQARQEKIVDYMNAMATVRWTPANDLVYTANNGTDQTYIAGETYTGLPYNGHNGSLERFLTCMASQDPETGIYTAAAGLESGGWVASEVVKRYVRVYQSTADSNIYVTSTTTTPEEVYTYDSAANTLLYSTESGSYYLGSDGTYAAFGTMDFAQLSDDQFPAHLYTDTGSLVTEPEASTAYKLGMETPEGNVLYFAAQTEKIDNVTHLSATSDMGEAADVYLESVSGGYHLYYQTEGDWTDTGFYLTMGNDCSSAVGWAWMQVSPVVSADVLEHNTPYKGGVYIQTTNCMIPNDTNRTAYGIYPVGSWQASKYANVNGTQKLVTAFDPADAAYSCTDEIYSAQVLNNNGKDTILEAYAQTHKADAVVTYVEHWNDRIGSGGHAQLVVADPVVVRSAKGVIDPAKSFMVLTEQGVNFGTHTTWNVEKKQAFNSLAATNSSGTAGVSSKTYLPVTMRVLKEDTLRNTYLIQVKNDLVTSPVTGAFYSYNRIHSVTVKVMDASGKIYYNREAFTGISTAYSGTGYRGRNNFAYMDDLHADAFYAAAAEKKMKSGTYYFFTVTVELTTGEIQTPIRNQAFAYQAPAAE